MLLQLISNMISRFSNSTNINPCTIRIGYRFLFMPGSSVFSLYWLWAKEQMRKRWRKISNKNIDWLFFNVTKGGFFDKEQMIPGDEIGKGLIIHIAMLSINKNISMRLQRLLKLYDWIKLNPAYNSSRKLRWRSNFSCTLFQNQQRKVMYCKNCGTLNDDNSKFCVQCGQPLKADNTQFFTAQKVSCTGTTSFQLTRMIWKIWYRVFNHCDTDNCEHRSLVYMDPDRQKFHSWHQSLYKAIGYLAFFSWWANLCFGNMYEKRGLQNNHHYN